MYNYPTIKLFDEIFGDFFNNSAINSEGIKTPIHDIIENDKEYVVELSLAGVEREHININVEEDVLIIKAKRNADEKLNYNRKQTYFGDYERKFILPDNVDVENIKASLSNGILTVVIPKVKDDKKLSKRIKIT